MCFSFLCLACLACFHLSLLFSSLPSSLFPFVAYPRFLLFLLFFFSPIAGVFVVCPADPLHYN